MGETLPTPFLLALIAASVVSATLTYRLIEQPVARIFNGHRWLVTAALTLTLAGLGWLGVVTAKKGGFPDRFPKAVADVLNFPGTDVARQIERYGENRCLYNFRLNFDSVDWHRRNIAEFYKNNDCLAVKDAAKPVIVLLGDSHAGHLNAGLREEFGQQANIIRLDSFYCVPLIETVATNAGRAGTERCHALNEFIFARLRELKPAVAVVGTYLWQYENDTSWIYPDYVETLKRDAQKLHRDGVGAIIIAGQVPTWVPTLPEVIGREMLNGETPPLHSFDGLQTGALETDRKLKRQPWGEGVAYVSVQDQLCNPQGCRRMSGPKMPDDILTMDYGHLGQSGSIFVVRNSLGPAIHAALTKAASQSRAPPRRGRCLSGKRLSYPARCGRVRQRAGRRGARSVPRC